METIAQFRHRFRLLLIVVLAGVGMTLVAILLQEPRVDVSAVVRGKYVRFNIPYAGINGILGFGVEDNTGKPLWTVRTSYEKGHTIVYGTVPAGGNMPACQLFPPEGKPADIRGQTVTVWIEYQYDKGFAPCCHTFRKTLVIPRTGESTLP